MTDALGGKTGSDNTDQCCGTHSQTTSFWDAYVNRVLPAATEAITAPTWVFIHGWGANANTWQPLLDAMNLTAEVWLLDLPGFGGNHRTVSGLEQLVDELVAILPAHSILVGWSLGGMLLPLLDERIREQNNSLDTLSAKSGLPKKIAQCISLASNVSFVQRDDYSSAMPPEVFSAFYESFDANASATWSRFSLLQTQGDKNRKQVSQTVKAIHAPPLDRQARAWIQALDWLGGIDNRARLSLTSTPFLHVLGAKDQLVPEAAAETIARLYPDHELNVLDGVGHVIHVSQPALLANLLRASECCGEKKRNKTRVAESFSRAASQYDDTARLQKTLADRLVEWVPVTASYIADLGCGTGYCGQGILDKKIVPAENLVSLDLAHGMLIQARQKRYAQSQAHNHFAGVCSDIESLPFGNDSFDTLVSGMSMQWSENLMAVFAEAYRVLQSGGHFVFTTLGPKTLHELRQAWGTADHRLAKSEWVHVNRFTSFEDLEQSAQQAGFTICEHRVEEHIVEYRDVMTLMRELKAIGAHNVNPGQEKGLTGKRRFKAMAEAYEHYRQGNGLLPLSYQVGFYRLQKLN